MQKNLVYIGIFLISVSTLILEISLTRIFSVMQWYHFAFMVIGIALLGYGVAGTFLSIFPSILKKKTKNVLFILSLLFSLTIIISFLIINNVPFDPFRITWDNKQVLYLLIDYGVLSLPFFFSGLFIIFLISKITKKVGKLYFFSLFGSGVGALLTIILFSSLKTNIIILSSLIAAIVALFFCFGNKKNVVFVSALIIFLLLLLIFFPLKINISPYKSLSTALKYPDAKLLFSEWNSFSRVDLVSSSAIRYAPGLSYKYKGKLPEQLALTIDGNNLNAITSYSNLDFIDFLPSSLAYVVQDGKKALIIEPAGGLEALTALYYNKSVSVFEINPIIYDVIKNRYNNFAGNIYDNVNVKIGEGRSLIKKEKEKYDIIQLSLIGDVSGSTGVFGLTENYLFTREAFEDYYECLSDDGILTITRYLMFPPKESIKLVSLAIDALDNRINVEKHIALIRTWTTTTFLLKKSEFSKEDIEKIKEFTKKREFDIIYLHNIELSEVNRYNKLPQPYYYQMVDSLLKNKNKLYKDYIFDIKPVTDNKPYFFNFFRWSKISDLYKSMGEKWQPFFESGFIVNFVFIQALILSIIFIFLPVYSFKKIKKKIKGKNNILAYFFFIGIGFMFVEIVLIQKFILFLGNPIYSISIVLCSLLIFSGIGSYFSSRLRLDNVKRVIIGLSLLIVIYLVSLNYVFNLFIAQELITKFIISTILLMPLGFLMGIPFPLGIRIADKLSNKLIPWAWVVNGCSSVLSSIGAVIIAISFGFNIVLLLAGVFYVLGLLMILAR